MGYLKKETINRIEQKLKTLNQLRPLPAVQVRKLKEQFQIEMAYNSNGIEGNSLTMKETFLVVNEGITIKGKPLKDHLEAKDHYAALQYLYDLVEKDKKHTVSELLIRHLHQLVVLDTDKEWAGKYRNGNVIIGGAKHTPPEAVEVPGQVHDLVVWLKQNISRLHPVELAAIFHHKLVFIHPFFDGNGRAARLAMNVLLMQKGYPLAVILKNDRKKYYRVLVEADKGNFVPLVRFIAQAVERSLNIYLNVLAIKTKKAAPELTLSQLAKKTRFSAKYLNLLARQGKLDAYKKGRNWVATERALKDYLEKRLRNRRCNRKIAK